MIEIEMKCIQAGNIVASEHMKKFNTNKLKQADELFIENFRSDFFNTHMDNLELTAGYDNNPSQKSSVAYQMLVESLNKISEDMLGYKKNLPEQVRNKTINQEIIKIRKKRNKYRRDRDWIQLKIYNKKLAKEIRKEKKKNILKAQEEIINAQKENNAGK